MFATARIAAMTPLRAPVRIHGVRRLRRPRTLAAAAVLVALAALTAGGPLVVVSTAPDDAVGAPAAVR
jgi:hypothetical protein